MNPLEYENLAWAERQLWWFRGMNRILFGLLATRRPVANPPQVLDAGGGTGYTARELARRYGWRVIPSDISGEAADSMSERYKLPAVQADMRYLPFADRVFDGVVSLDALVHLESGEERKALDEFARVVKPGGFLMLRVAALRILRSRHSTFVGEKQRFTRAALVQSAEAAGFEIERSTYANSLLLPIALLRFRVWEPLMKSAPTSGTGRISPLLNALLGLPLALEAKLILKGWTFPAGQSVVLLGRRREHGMNTEAQRVAPAKVHCPRCRAWAATRTARTRIEKFLTEWTSYRKWRCNICDRTFWAASTPPDHAGAKGS